MKKVLPFILFFIPLFAISQKVKVLASPGEYTTLLLRNDSAFDATQGKPILIATNVAKIFGGAHHYFVLYKTGIIAGAGDGSSGELGNGTTNGSATPISITVDNLGNTLPQIVDMCLSANLSSPYWQSAAIGIDGSLYVCGTTSGGNGGNNTTGSSIVNRFTKVPFPAGTIIKKVQGGREMIAMDAAGNVWTWGGNNDIYCLGQGSSPVNYKIPTKISFGGEVARDIAGGSNWNYILTTTNHVWSWCYQYLTDYNGTYPSGSNPTSPENITSILNFPTTVSKIYVNNESSYAILSNGTLWAWGGNANGSIGNGDELDYSKYGGYPVPNGTTNPFYWAWDQGFHELQVFNPVQIAKGKSNWTDLYVTNALCYTVYASDANNNLYGWGRNKQSICYGMVAGNFQNGAIQADYPNSWDCPFPKLIDPFAVLNVYQSTSKDCLKSASAQLHHDACSIYTPGAHTPPIASLFGSINNNQIVLDNTGSSDAQMILYRIIRQTGGPATLDMNVQDAPQDTISTAGGAVIPQGTYTFKVTIINNNWDSTISTTSVIVGPAPPNVSAGFNQTIVLPTTSANLAGTASGNNGSTISSTLWSQVSGPSTATFSSTNTLNTIVSNLMVGSYIFNLKATDSNGRISNSQVQITVNFPLSPSFNGIIFKRGHTLKIIRP